jgi:hypothetical protein
MVVFDRAYNYYHQFALWSSQRVFFVTRLKQNAVYDVVATYGNYYRSKDQEGVLCDEIIDIQYHPEGKDGKKLTYLTRNIRLRKVSYQDEKGRFYEFLTNNFDITAEEVAFLYKKRWGIEILFKKMKQNFQLHYFYGENVNAIYTQVWCTLIAQLLLTVIQKMSNAKKAFSVVASLIRIHLISLLDVYELLRSTRRAFNTRTESPPSLQLSLNL